MIDRDLADRQEDEIRKLALRSIRLKLVREQFETGVSAVAFATSFLVFLYILTNF